MHYKSNEVTLNEECTIEDYAKYADSYLSILLIALKRTSEARKLWENAFTHTWQFEIVLYIQSSGMSQCLL